MQMRNHLKPWIPPVAWPLVRAAARLGRRPQWQYVADAWPTGDPRSTGWRHPSVIAAQLRRWPDFVAAVQSRGPLGISHEAPRIVADDIVAQSWLLAFAYVLGRAAAARGSLSVLDWGGGLGYYAVVAKVVLPEIALDYTVMELPEACAAGSGLLPDIVFSSDADSCLSRQYDLVFASNTLQYAEDWPALLARLAGAAGRWLLLTRLPLVERSKSFVVVQRPDWVGYRTEYLSWVFERAGLLAGAAAQGLELEREFLTTAEPPTIAGAPEKVGERGFLFRSRAVRGFGERPTDPAALC